MADLLAERMPYFLVLASSLSHKVSEFLAKKSQAAREAVPAPIPALYTETKRTRIMDPGSSDFDKVIEKKSLIIDKTLFIQEFMINGNEISCILRPRRFGKSTNLNMLKAFLSIGAKAPDFERFAIGKNKAFMEKHCGQYPVVYLDLKDCKANSWEGMLEQVRDSIIDMIESHEELLPGFLDILNRRNIDLYGLHSPPRMDRVLQILTQALFKHHKKRVIVLIDEYDAPLNHAALHDFYDPVSEFLGGFFSSALKGNSALEKACLVGIVEIKGGGILSGLNNVTIYSVQDEIFSKQFGFTQEEIRDFLGDDEKDKVNAYMELYNGYQFGSHSLINPYSFMASYKQNTFKEAWIISSAPELVANMISKIDRSQLAGILKLLEEGEKIACPRLQTTVNYTNQDWDFSSLLHFLVLAGYLTYCRSDDTGSLENNVRIPNREVHSGWIRISYELLKQRGILLPDFVKRIHKAFTTPEFDVVEVHSLLESWIIQFSFFDLTAETSYHCALFSALLVCFQAYSDIKVISNRESGHGRYDIAVHFQTTKRVIILEFKKSSEENNLENDAKKALKQIQNREYGADYEDCECIFVGMAFCNKLVSPLEVSSSSRTSRA